MTPHGVLKEVFFVLMCAFVMVILAELFFSTDDNGWFHYDHGVSTNNTTTIQQVHAGAAHDGIGDGAIWYMSYQIQLPISMYYYNYCCLPNYHMEDSIKNEFFRTNSDNIDNDLVHQHDASGRGTFAESLNLSADTMDIKQADVYTTGWQ